VRISISLAILSEIFIQIGYFFKSYTRKQKLMFFLNTVYAIVAKFQDRIKIIICEITFVQGSVNKKVQVWQSSTNE